MSRFQVLELVSRFPYGASMGTLETRAGQFRRSQREALRTQLNRLHRWGLVSRQARTWRRGYHYKITMRGRERLIWARNQGLI